MGKLSSAIWLLLVATPLIVLAGCETYTCRSACTRVYSDCGVPAFLPCESSESNVDCSAVGAWEAHQEDMCLQDCQSALYTLKAGTDDGTSRGLFDEEDATRFIQCVVNTECDELLRDAQGCGIIW
jgi:hypothetical protein